MSHPFWSAKRRDIHSDSKETLKAQDIYFTRNGEEWPLLASSAPSTLRNVLNTDSWDTPGKWDNMSRLAQDAVNVQVASYNAYLAERRTHGPAQLKAELSSEELTHEAFSKLSKESRTRVPYPLVRSLAHSIAAGAQEPPAKRGKGKGGKKKAFVKVDVDEWILLYEKHLSFTRHCEDGKWARGLITLAEAEAVFPGSTLSYDRRVITRPALQEKQTGLNLLGDRRRPTISIQPSVSAFKARFDELTGGILNGLDWCNVFVAGGIVLGTLLVGDQAVAAPPSPKPPVNAENPSSDDEPKAKNNLWEASDIDIYIHGLDATAATAKITHIFDVYRANLPPDAPTLVVRNAKTFTFYSTYSVRRIQIVLKLVKTPKDVLLNFDLDICAMGWDGSEVYMLPRCARAIETGYNVFTMNMIQGHYLSERRASQERRVSKYAYRGYGIRILPSYIASLKQSQKKLQAIARGEDLYPKLDVKYIGDESRAWTKTVITALHPSKDQAKKIKCSHADLRNGDQVTAEVQSRSALSGFGLLMRHVALWEMEHRGEVNITDGRWHETTYSENDNSGLSYDDTPGGWWDEEASILGMKSDIDQFNQYQITGWIQNSEGQFADVTVPRAQWPLRVPDVFKPLQRITYAETPAEVLMPEKDVVMGVLLPYNFALFANELVEKALADAGLPTGDAKILTPLSDDAKALPPDPTDASLKFFLWRIPGILLWQQIDRRIDEVFEALWAFFYIHDRLIRSNAAKNAQLRLVSLLSKRAIVEQVENEFEAFARWIGRKPMYIERFFKGDDNFKLLEMDDERAERRRSGSDSEEDY
uniref:Uncharacterized protein n=1 Tax=Mycena chlorophos TaxID=658473 RepID=A0ABQ0LK85_MYCCL|nr:predicted protein [Mycena chlorophos]